MRILGCDIPAKSAAWAAGLACAALLLGITLSPTHHRNESNLSGDESSKINVRALAEHTRVLLSEEEIATLKAEEEANAVDQDISDTEEEEMQGLFSSIDEVTDMVSAATSECVEDVSEEDPPADGLEYNASLVVVPCADEEEMEDYSLQLQEVETELSAFLDDGLDSEDDHDFDMVYMAYKKQFKEKRKDGDDLPNDSPGNSKSSRKNEFKKNLRRIKAHNNEAKGKKEGIDNEKGKAKGGKVKGNQAKDRSKAVVNKFTDWSEEEFNKIMFADNENIFFEGFTQLDDEDISEVIKGDVRRRHLQQDTFSWVGSGKLGRVVNQGPCGSCYLNAVVTEVESSLAIKTGEAPLALSREQIKNCQKENFRYLSSSPRGCNGGWMRSSYEYIRRNWLAGCTATDSSSTGCDISREAEGGITLETDYPYMASNRQCGFNPDEMPKRAIVGSHLRYSGSKYIAPSEANFKTALADGPVVVALSATGWGSYGGGVKTCNQRSINHAVLLVGWGEQDGEKYWLIQNSWGTNWGEGGFIKIKRGLNVDGSEKTTRGSPGDEGCGMTVYTGFQSKYVEKFDPTVIDCQGKWSDWSDCSQECEGGTQTKTYIVTQSAVNGGMKCPYNDGYEKTRDCQYTTNIVQDWTTCSADCNGGEQTKITQIASTDASTLSSCEEKTETRSCNTHMCPDSCLIVADAPYSFMNGNYHPSTGSNNYDRCSGDVPIYTNQEKNNFKLFWYKRKCSSPGDGYWVFYRSVGRRGYMWSRRVTEGTSPLAIKWYNNRNNIKIKALDCSLLPVDCDGQWGDWSECDADCDGGTMTQEFKIFQEPQNGGKACPANRVKECNKHSCGTKCMKVSNARYSFLNGVYTGQEGGYMESWCGGNTLPRYSKTTVKKYWWRTYTYKYDLVFSNTRCRWSSGKYTAVGGSWAMGKVYTRRGRNYVGSYDRSPYGWRNYISSSNSKHPDNAGWETSATLATDWYKKGVTTVEEVACTS